MNRSAVAIVVIGLSSFVAAQQRPSPQVEWPYYSGEPGGTRHSPLADIKPDNSVDSSLIADARVEFTGRGDINDQVERGWLTKVLDSLNPF